MFERFTDRARRVVVLAQEGARMLGHEQIEPLHVLWGLIEEGEGVAAQVLAEDGITAVAVQKRLPERRDECPPGHMPFTPDCKKAIELSLREALQLGCTYIGTEHILLGLERGGHLDTIPGLADVRDDVMAKLRSYEPPAPVELPESEKYLALLDLLDQAVELAKPLHADVTSPLHLAREAAKDWGGRALMCERRREQKAAL